MSAVTARHSPARAWPADAAVTARRGWDPLLLAVATYVLTAVGRIHQLFGALEASTWPPSQDCSAIVLYFFDDRDERRADAVPRDGQLAGVAGWMMLSVPGALRQGNSFDLVFDNFLKTALMSFIVAASIRHAPRRRAVGLVYLAGAVVYTGVVITAVRSRRRRRVAAGASLLLRRERLCDVRGHGDTARPLLRARRPADGRPPVRGGEPRRPDARVRPIRFARRLHRAVGRRAVHRVPVFGDSSRVAPLRDRAGRDLVW